MLVCNARRGTAPLFLANAAMNALKTPTSNWAPRNAAARIFHKKKKSRKSGQSHFRGDRARIVSRTYIHPNKYCPWQSLAYIASFWGEAGRRPMQTEEIRVGEGVGQTSEGGRGKRTRIWEMQHFAKKKRKT